MKKYIIIIAGSLVVSSAIFYDTKQYYKAVQQGKDIDSLILKTDSTLNESLEMGKRLDTLYVESTLYFDTILVKKIKKLK